MISINQYRHKNHEEELFRMKVTVNEVDQHKVTLHIEVSAEDAAKGAAAAVKILQTVSISPVSVKGRHRAWCWKAS